MLSHIYDIYQSVLRLKRERIFWHKRQELQTCLPWSNMQCCKGLGELGKMFLPQFMVNEIREWNGLQISIHLVQVQHSPIHSSMYFR